MLQELVNVTPTFLSPPCGLCLALSNEPHLLVTVEKSFFTVWILTWNVAQTLMYAAAKQVLLACLSQSAPLCNTCTCICMYMYMYINVRRKWKLHIITSHNAKWYEIAWRQNVSARHNWRHLAASRGMFSVVQWTYLWPGLTGRWRSIGACKIHVHVRVYTEQLSWTWIHVRTCINAYDDLMAYYSLNKTYINCPQNLHHVHTCTCNTTQSCR